MFSYSAINITWREPEKWNGVPDKYQLEYHAINFAGSPNVVDNIPTDILSRNIENLTGFTEYRFRVSCFQNRSVHMYTLQKLKRIQKDFLDLRKTL